MSVATIERRLRSLLVVDCPKEEDMCAHIAMLVRVLMLVRQREVVQQERR